MHSRAPCRSQTPYSVGGGARRREEEGREEEGREDKGREEEGREKEEREARRKGRRSKRRCARGQEREERRMGGKYRWYSLCWQLINWTMITNVPSLLPPPPPPLPPSPPSYLMYKLDSVLEYGHEIRQAK